MPLKWKIFRVANYLLLLTVLSLMGLIIYFFADGSSPSSDDIFYFLLFTLGASILGTDFSLNIYLLERYYPDTDPGERLQVLIAIVFFISCLLIAFLSIVWIMEFYDIFARPVYDEPFPNRPRIVAVSLGTILLISYYVFWMQVALRKTIQRNRRKIYSTFLDSNHH